MKLAEIIKTNNWLSIEITLLKLYPDQKKNIEVYKKIYSQLQAMKPVDSKIEILIEQEINEETKEAGMGNVYGIDHESKDEITKEVALEYTKWDMWLGMPINKLTQKEFSELEIISHCIYEMTFMGYHEEEIQEELARLIKMTDDYKSLSLKEKELKTKSIDKLLKDLKKKK